jgi:hypothetical protein
MRRFARLLAELLFGVAMRLWEFSRGRPDAGADHIRTTVKIADWPEAAADELIGRGVTALEVSRMFSEELRREKIQ